MKSALYQNILGLMPRVYEQLKKSGNILDRNELKDLKTHILRGQNSLDNLEKVIRYFHAVGIIEQLKIDERSGTSKSIEEVVLSGKIYNNNLNMTFFEELEIGQWRALYLLSEIKMKCSQNFTLQKVYALKGSRINADSKGRILKQLEYLIDLGFLEKNGEEYSFLINDAVFSK